YVCTRTHSGVLHLVLSSMFSFIIHCLFFNDPAPSAFYTLSLHDALPISVVFSLLDFLPELHWRWAYPLVILALLVVCALVYRRRSEEHTSELQSRENLVCRLLLEKKKKTQNCCILHS